MAGKNHKERKEEKGLKDDQFFKDLYDGYTGEQFLIGSLYRQRFDAFRPPADFGIDVVALNAKGVVRGNPPEPQHVLYFQVKTKVLYDSAKLGTSGGRATHVFDVFVKDSDLRLLEGHKDRALVVYVFDGRTSAAGAVDAMETPLVYFWLDGEKLAQLREAGAVRDRTDKNAKPNRKRMRIRLVEPSNEQQHWYACVVGEGGNDLPNHQGFLGAAGSEGQDSMRYSLAGYLQYVGYAQG